MNVISDQYRDSSKLGARMALHRKYGPAPDRSDLARRMGFQAGERVLEVGCGPGRFWADAAAVAPADLHIVITDISPGMVTEAKARLSSIGRWCRVRAAVADVCALPFEDGAFDVVAAMHMLYHAKDPGLGVSEIARVLKPGGRVVVTTNGAGNLTALTGLGRQAFGDRAVGLGVAAFTLENGPAMLARCFATVATARSVDTLRVTDPTDAIAYLTSYPPGDTATAAELERLTACVEEAFSLGGGVLCVERDTGALIAHNAVVA